MKSHEIKKDDGEVIKEIEEEGYEYLGVTEAEKINQKKMKETLYKEFLRRVLLGLHSKLNGCNKLSVLGLYL